MTHKHRIETEHIPMEEPAPKLAAEDIDESMQSIQEAAYFIGMDRVTHGRSGDHLADWFEAERAVKGNID